MAEFKIRKERFYNEFRWLYCELYEGCRQEFEELMGNIASLYTKRSATLKKKDRQALLDPDYYKKSRWDLGKAKEKMLKLKGSFEEHTALDTAVFELIEQANEGANLIRLIGVPLLFTSGAESFRKAPGTHSVLRMLRMAAEIVCPSVLLLCETEEDLEQAAAYIGSPEKPECHIVSGHRFMPALWHTLATRDVRLLAHEIQRAAELRHRTVMTQELLSEKAIFWRLDYGYLSELGMDARIHHKFLNSYFTGSFQGSSSSAKISRSVKAGEIGVRGSAEELIGEDLKEKYKLLHAVFCMQSGLLTPPPSAGISKMTLAVLKNQKHIRSAHRAFDTDADVWTVAAADNKVLIIGRYKEGEKLYGVFNFSDAEQTFALHDPGSYINLMNGEETEIVNLIRLRPYGFAWICTEK